MFLYNLKLILNFLKTAFLYEYKRLLLNNLHN